MPQPKKPTKILELSGAFKKNPNRKPASEPKPTGDIGKCPRYLDKKHSAIWDEIVNNCAKGVLTNQDRPALELIVIGMNNIRHGELKEIDGKEITVYPSGAERDRVFKQLGKFGMTPSERSNVIVDKDDDDKGPSYEL